MLRRRVRPDVLRSESAGELDESRRSGCVVSDGSRRPRVVSVSNYDDRILGSAGNDGDDVAQLDVSQVREVLGPHVLLGREPQSGNRLRVPSGRLRSSLRARHPRRELGRQRLRQRGRIRAVEQWLEWRARERSRCRDRKQEGENCRRDDNEAHAHEPCVKRAFNSAATQPATARPGPNCFHRGAIVSAPRAAGPRDLSDADFRFDNPPR